MARSSALALTLALAASIAACGARSGIRGASAPDAGIDTGVDANLRRDAGDAGMPCERCDDGVLCNGRELCGAGGACLPGAPETCDDGDPCTTDRCAEATDTCLHIPDDRDADGDGVSTCAGDCDDTSPTISPSAPEVCNTVDDDCDALTDEGVLSMCNDCRPGCRHELVPEPGEPWDLGDSSGVDVGPDGWLRLSETRTETFSAWIANYLFATVTRIDTRTGAQIGEYDSVLRDGTNGAAPPGEECETERAGGNCPSRTAVDLHGAVYVANRAFFAQGTVTKIAGFEEDCIDRDGDGAIDTSRDLDGDGIIERSVPGEFLGQLDECVLWTVDVGGVGDIPRALTIDASGNVWVGLHNGREAWELDPTDGRHLRTVTMPGGGVPFSPYGAATDSEGNVWFVAVATGRVVGIDTVTGRVVHDATGRSRDGCSGSYGLAIDERDRVWVAGFSCPYVYMYTPSVDRWDYFPIPDSGGTRGIAADGRGRIYVASSHTFIRILGGLVLGDPISRLTVLDSETGEVIRVLGTTAAPLPGLGSTGVGLDSAGSIWLVNQMSSTVTRIDPTTFATRDFATGTAPYTYSDFTGYALRTFVAPTGFVRSVVTGCEVGPTEWERVDWVADVPAGTRVELRARTASRSEDLAAATWRGPLTARPTELMLPPGPIGSGRFLELEIQLFSEGGSVSPSVSEVSVQLNCP